MLVRAWSAIALEEDSQLLVLVKGSQFIARVLAVHGCENCVILLGDWYGLVLDDSGGVFTPVLARNAFRRYF